MDAELTALAASGATALVQQMVGDGWEQVRDRLARWMSRGRGGQAAAEAVQEELDASREDLLAARDGGDEDTASDLQVEWRNRMGRVLRADPALAAELRSLLAELAPEAPGAQGQHVYNTISGGVQHGTVIQAGNIGSLHSGPSGWPEQPGSSAPPAR